MTENVRAQPASKKSGFLREGFRELGRKGDRRKLEKQSQQQATERGDALTRLGERAWQKKVDLTALPALRDQLTRLDSRAGELTATTTKLQGEKATLETRRQAESAKYDALRKAVEENKRPVDAALAAARDRLTEQNRAVERHQARLTSLAAELSALEKAPAPPAGPATPESAAQLAARETRKQQIPAEQKQASEELASANSAVSPLAAEVSRLYGESQRFTEEINKVESDRKAALSPIEADLDRVGREASAATQEAGSVAVERRAAFTQLGVALYERKSAEPAHAAGIAEVAAIDQRRASTQAALEASLALTRAMPPRTMAKFWSTLILGPLLLIGLVVGSYSGWTWWRHLQLSKEFGVPAPEINPYLSHPLASHPAYVLADRLAAAHTEQEAADRMLDAFRAIHLGVYSYDGKQVLAGSERNDKDFYLYDFEWRTLAHAFAQHNLMNFDDESRLLGAALVRLDRPERLAPLLRRAVALRYRNAAKQPNAPTSFLILLVDGLARHQLKPYSLGELVERPGKDLYLDPFQCFLIMLDFFTKPPTKAAAPVARLIRFPWDWVRTVHAGGPCDGVKGDDSLGEWGEGVGNAATVAQEVGEVASSELSSAEARELAEKIGKGAEAVGTATDVAGGISDLLTLYAITIRITAEPYAIHLNHGGVNHGFFWATVTYELKDPPPGPIPCGSLAGNTLPGSPEPMKEVELTWDIKPEWPGYLVVPSEMVDALTGHLGFQTKTGPDGKSMFEVEVTKDCPDRSGRTVGRDFMMTASARVVSKKMPSPATGVEGPLAIASLISKLLPGGLEYLMGGRTGYVRFRVEWHKKLPKPRGSGQR